MIDDEIDVLARTLWGEARGEGIAGMEAVAAVVENRVHKARAWKERLQKAKHPLFGDGTFAGACLVPWQFSCWNKADPNREKLMRVDDRDERFVAALGIARIAVEGNLDDPTFGATHYHAASLTLPAWALGKKPCAIVGNHLFYNDVS